MTTLPAEPLDLHRTRLLERIHRTAPKILVLLAPAGFGKSSLVRQLIGPSGRSAICDCAEVRDDLDLARRLLDALGEREAALGDGALSVAERLNLALEKWREKVDVTVVFENAEHFAEVPIAREFFARLFANRPEQRKIIVCTRKPFRISLTRYAPPHEILVLRAGDLAFDTADIKAIFAPYTQDEKSIERVAAISGGWPIAVLLLRRFATEGRIATLLDRLDDIAFQELHDYIQDEVVSQLDGGIRRALFVCATIPNTTANDLRASGIPETAIDDLTEISKQSPFVSHDGVGVFRVHPLIAALLREGQADRRAELLQALAALYEHERDFPRAAELLLAAGDAPNAARVLAEHEVLRDHTPRAEYVRVLGALDGVLIHRYPRLWSMTAVARLFGSKSETLLDEAESLWRTLPPDVTPMQRYYVLVLRALLMSYLGLFEPALAMVEEFAVTARAQHADEVIPYVGYIRGLLLSRMGRLSEGEAELHSALPHLEEMDIFASGTYMSLGADIARVRGERAIERQFVERAIERARRSALPNFVAFDYAEALIGAWLAGETRLFDEYATKLDECVQRGDVKGFTYLSAVACRRSLKPAETDLSTYVAFGRLMALANIADEEERLNAAHLAYRAAKRTHKPFLLTLSATAVALLDTSKAEEFFNAAREAAAQCDSPALRTAIDLIQSGCANAGMLTAFVAYVTKDHSKVVRPVAVGVMNGTIVVDGQSVAISGRELELVLALALRRESTPRARLAAMLWPDLEAPAALNALSVCLHRARAHLGRRDAIVRDGDGYALHPEAFVDLWELERLTPLLRGRDALTEAQRAALMSLWNALRGRRPASADRWEWFEPTERRLREQRIEVAHRLAGDALTRGATEFAIELTNDLIEIDPCDETAREIAIRAHLLEGDRPAAVRQYRQYREILQAELQCEPSRSITELVMQ